MALLLSFSLLSTIGGLLTAALFLPAAKAVQVTADTSVQMFKNLPEDLDIGPLSEQSRLRYADGTVMATFFAQNRIVVGMKDIAPAMQHAVVATEDKRFFEHGAIDLLGMMRAVGKMIILDGATEGASTLTQQFVKNLLIEQALRKNDPAAVAAATAQTLSRKAREAKLAVWVEQKMTKEQILEGYLNIAQFGTRVYGVESAARYYFGVHAKDLTYLQAATIAGITQQPGRYDPTVNPLISQDRRNTVLKLMHDQGYITDQEFQTGAATPLASTLKITPTPVGCETAGDAAFFCDYVMRTIMGSPEFGKTKEERRRLLYEGGLDIWVTLDPRLQAAAAKTMAETISPTDPSGTASAVTTVQPGTGHILAMAQTRPYSTSDKPAPGYTALNYSVDFNYGGSSGFQPGSSFKPFTLAAWLAAGKNLNQRVSANTKVWDGPIWKASCIDSGPVSFGYWRPTNVDGAASGPITVLSATERSVNTAYADMASQLDQCSIKTMAETLGFHRADETDYALVPSQTLGVNLASPLTMASAYATFAANGTRCDPVAITKVTSTRGKDYKVPQANCKPGVVPQEVTSAVSYALQKTINYGEAPASLGSFPAAGKTGTSENNAQTWFVGYTPLLSTAVWVGSPAENIPLQGVTINGKYYPYLYGSELAAPTWRHYMSQAVQGMEPIAFPKPDDKQIVGDRVPVPDVINKDYQAATAQLEASGFSVVVKQNQNSPKPHGTVLNTDPAPGAKVPPGTEVGLTVSVGPGAGPQPSPGPKPPRP